MNMPQLVWDETDFVACLEVLPIEDEYSIGQHFNVERNGISLCVSVWQFESVISLSLSHDKNLIVSITLAVRGQVLYIKDKRGEYLELRDCVVISNRFYTGEVKDVFDRAKFTDHLNVEIWIKPHLHIEFK